MTKTTWNYRVTRQVVDGETVFGIREAYYDDDHLVSWTENAVEPQGETLDELREDLRYMAAALDLPVVDLELEHGRSRAIHPANVDGWQPPVDPRVTT